jgi:hypothetical protein
MSNVWISNLSILSIPDEGYYRNAIVRTTFVVNTSRSFPRSWLITGFVTRLTRRVSLLEQELLTLPEDLSSPPVFSGVRVTRSLVLYVCFVDRCLSFFFWPLCCLFFFDIRILITSLWYLQTLLDICVIIVECQAPCSTLKTSFVDSEKKAHYSCYKRINFSSLPNFPYFSSGSQRQSSRSAHPPFPIWGWRIVVCWC